MGLVALEMYMYVYFRNDIHFSSPNIEALIPDSSREGMSWKLKSDEEIELLRNNTYKIEARG